MTIMCCLSCLKESSSFLKHHTYSVFALTVYHRLWTLYPTFSENIISLMPYNYDVCSSVVSGCMPATSQKFDAISYIITSIWVTCASGDTRQKYQALKKQAQVR